MPLNCGIDLIKVDSLEPTEDFKTYHAKRYKGVTNGAVLKGRNTNAGCRQKWHIER